MGKLFDERHLLFWAIYIAFMLFFAEIVSQVYEDKVECESVAASLLIKWNLYQQNSGSKTTELPKAADTCTNWHIRSPMNCIYLNRNTRITWRLGLSASTCLTGFCHSFAVRIHYTFPASSLAGDLFALLFAL